MVNVIGFSGGKDSTALVLWAKENLENVVFTYCDTGWEAPETYEYIDYINREVLGGSLVVLRSEKYDGLVDLSMKKGRFPSPMARFCTEQLKVIPTRDFLKSHLPDVRLYLGIRADESQKRAEMPEYGFDQTYGCEIHRPLLRWTAAEVFDFIKSHGVEVNPLYKKGARRVGCYPCVMCNLSEMRQIIRISPETIDKVREAEELTGRTFFAPKYIPERFRSKTHEASGKKCGTIDDIVKYLHKHDDIELFDEPGDSCMSYYNLCE